MKIQVLSDLHLEHGGFVPEHHPAADVIVLAGDLAPYTEGVVEHHGEHWVGERPAHPLHAREPDLSTTAMYSTAIGAETREFVNRVRT